MALFIPRRLIAITMTATTHTTLVVCNHVFLLQPEWLYLYQRGMTKLIMKVQTFRIIYKVKTNEIEMKRKHKCMKLCFSECLVTIPMTTR